VRAETASSLLAARLGAARAGGHKLLVPFVSAGFPDAAATGRMLAGLAEAGADAIELGVPFSDPLADGPVIAAASERALAGGMTLSLAVEIGARYAGRKEPAPEERPPLVLFTYLNPFAALGVRSAAAACRDAGFGGVLIADLPFDEDPELAAELAAAGLPLIRLAAPTTPPARLHELARGAEGFVYLIARTGVTGSGAGADRRLAEQVATIRAVTGVPVVVGFGIEDADGARRAAALADGVVVGTALVQRLATEGEGAALDWFRRLRVALDAG
jgi:tryptophan synthase alpha chain